MTGPWQERANQAYQLAFDFAEIVCFLFMTRRAERQEIRVVFFPWVTARITEMMDMQGRCRILAHLARPRIPCENLQPLLLPPWIE